MRLKIAMMMILGLAGAAAADTIKVPGDYPTIQEAVNASQDGDEILVGPGTYTRASTEVVNMLGKQITLRSSDGPEVTIIDGEGLRNGILCEYEDGEAFTIDGFTVRNCEYLDGCCIYGDGIKCIAGVATIANCIIENNRRAARLIGSPSEGYPSATFLNCIVRSNDSGVSGESQNGFFTFNQCVFEDNKGAAIGLNPYYTNCLVEQCEFVGNESSGNAGAIYRGGNSAAIFLIRNSLFDGNVAANDGGAIWAGSGPVDVVNCQFVNNRAAGSGGAMYGQWSSTVEDSTFCKNWPDHIYHPEIYLPWIDLGGNEFCDLVPPVIHVPGDYPTIQGAIDATPDGFVIQIAAGTFYEHEIYCFNRNLTIQGTRNPDGSLATIVDGLQLGGVFFLGVSPDLVLKDLVITGASGCSDFDDMGWMGAIYFWGDQNSASTIIGCTITGNSTCDDGAGIYIDINARPTIIDCLITDNYSPSTGGGIYAHEAAPTIIGCTITANTGGGGLYWSYEKEFGQLTLTDTMICANAGGQANLDGPWIDGGGNWISGDCFVDCNENGVLDEEDIANGTSEDCNQNLVPDECEEDCDGDGVINDCDSDPDTDGDGLPDNCDEVDDPITAYWVDSQGGEFHDPDNWNSGQSPVFNTTVVFDLLADYTVDFSQDAETAKLIAEQGLVELDLAGHVYQASNDNSTSIIGNQPGSQSILSVGDGSLVLGTGAQGDAELIVGFEAGSFGDFRLAGLAGSETLLDLHKLQIADRGIGLMSVSYAATVEVGRVLLGNIIGSNGNLILSGDGSLLNAEIEFSVNHGTVEIQSPAELRFDNPDAPMTVFKGGQLIGDGTLKGYLLNRGYFSPSMTGNSFDLQGDYRNRGLFGVTLGDTQHSRVEVTSFDDWYGEIRLGGGLIAELDEGFLPEIGREFQIMEAEDRVRGTFDVAFMPDLGDDRYLAIRYPGDGFRGGDEDVELVVVGFDEVLGFDEPDSLDLDGPPLAMLIADLDNDLDDDIAVSSPGLVYVYYNDGGVFNDVVQISNVGKTAVDLAAGDFDADGLLDLVGANGGGDEIFVALNSGGGNFESAIAYPTGVGTNPRAIAVDDFNNDGRDDVAIACTSTGEIRLWRSEDAGGVRAIAFNEDQVMEVGDAPIGIDPGEVEENKDLERIDLVFALNGENSVGVLRNVGGEGGVIDFEFDEQDDLYDVGVGPVSLALADLNGDGRIDIVTANQDAGQISILLHEDEPTAEFLASVDLPVGDEASSISLADLDGDGDQDIALIATAEGEDTSSLFVLRNDSSLTDYEQFLISAAETFVIDGIPVIVDRGDLDLDGLPDLITINEPGSGLRGDSDALGLVRSDPATKCDGDQDGDGIVGVDDVLLILASWNNPYTIDDLLVVLGAWGPCS
ncbi:MAG: hypothetical protein CMJ39_09875 [Phycisphaerae bacterium]|nr:hypothetical protein [Phycisphaerae bacterium]